MRTTLSEVLGRPVSRETSQRLEDFIQLLRKWNPKINLVARSTLDDIDIRHVVDSAQVANFRKDASSWVDLGSGGGFPGMILAILFAELAPDVRVTLVESDRRKAQFLREAGRLANVDVEVVPKRIEDLGNRRFDVVSARALAPLSRLLSFSEELLAPAGRCVFLKGANHQAELDEALKQWQFEHSTVPSATSDDSVVLLIEGLARV